MKRRLTDLGLPEGVAWTYVDTEDFSSKGGAEFFDSLLSYAPLHPPLPVLAVVGPEMNPPPGTETATYPELLEAGPDLLAKSKRELLAIFAWAHRPVKWDYDADVVERATLSSQSVKARYVGLAPTPAVMMPVLPWQPAQEWAEFEVVEVLHYELYSRDRSMYAEDCVQRPDQEDRNTTYVSADRLASCPNDVLQRPGDIVTERWDFADSSIAPGDLVEYGWRYDYLTRERCMRDAGGGNDICFRDYSAERTCYKCARVEE